ELRGCPHSRRAVLPRVRDEGRRLAKSRPYGDFVRIERFGRGEGEGLLEASYSSLRSPRITLSWYRLSKNTESRVRPSSLNPIFFARARLASFSAKDHHVTRGRLCCSNASRSTNLTTSVLYPFFQRSFSSMATPMFAP